MFKIVEKKSLNPTVSKITVEAPLIAKKAEPGQFIIFRAKEDSERIPLTIADFDREAGTVTIIYQIVGAGTMELDTLKEGEYIHDFVGPLGVPTHTEGLKKVAVVGGGVGCAIAYFYHIHTRIEVAVDRGGAVGQVLIYQLLTYSVKYAYCCMLTQFSIHCYVNTVFM